jgi:hypothetical protein
VRDAQLAAAIWEALPRVHEDLALSVPARATFADDDPRGRIRLRMSDLGRCPRQVSYRLRDGEPSIDGRAAWLFLSGRFYEQLLLAALAAVPGVELVTPVGGGQWLATWEHPPVVGYLDGLARMPVPYPLGTRATVAVEVKSAGASLFARYRRALSLAEAFPAYYAQIQGYLHAMDLRYGLCIMACRGQPDLVAEWVPCAPQYVASLLERALTTWRAVAVAGTLAEPAPTGDECRYCAFRDRCEVPALAAGREREIGGKRRLRVIAAPTGAEIPSSDHLEEV